MSEKENKTKKLSLTALILMIFTSVYGFNNMPRSFFLMGYGAIPFYIISAVAFFVPFAFMITEYGSAFKDEKGGIFSWMQKSVNTKYAFVATFMWYTSQIIWMVNVSSGIMIPFSNALFGVDTTQQWSLFGLSSTQTLGIIAIALIIFITAVASKGLDKIKKVASVGGIAVAALNIVLILGAVLVFIGNKGQLAQPITSGTSFIQSPNPSYLNTLSTLSFLVYAIFAYGGTEIVGGLVDQTDHPEKNFAKGITIAAIIIAVGYSIGIFCVGVFTNWQSVLSSDTVNKANASYVIMNNLGYQVGAAFGASENVCIQMGNWTARFVGLSLLLCLSGAFFTMIYAPLKQLIEGCPKGLLPEKLCKIEDGMPKHAMKVQAIVVVAIIALVSVGGKSASKFFDILVAMTNVAMTIPYMFMSGAFIKFKHNQKINKPFSIFKKESMITLFTVLVTFTVGFANVFSIIEPAIHGDVETTVWSVLGPVFFTAVALILNKRYEKNRSAQNSNEKKSA